MNYIPPQHYENELNLLYFQMKYTKFNTSKWYTLMEKIVVLERIIKNIRTDKNETE